jgi:hypothetical protein
VRSQGDVAQDATLDPEMSFHYSPNATPEPFEVKIVYSEAQPPPTRLSEEVRNLCRIPWIDMPSARELPLRYDDNLVCYRELNVGLRMVVQGAWLEFAIMYEGERVAWKRVALDYSGAIALVLPKIAT